MLKIWFKSAVEFITDIVKKYNKSPLFKPIAFLVAILLLTLGYQIYTEIKTAFSEDYSYSASDDDKEQSDKEENEQPQDDKKLFDGGIDLPLGIHIGSFSIFVFLSLVAALAVIEYKKKQKLKSSDEERSK